MHTVYLAFGTNLGDKEENITEAYRQVELYVGNIKHRSSIIETEPWGFESENTFLNSVAYVETALTPHQLLRATQHIEKVMGRKQKSNEGIYHDRIIDIDILLYDDISINEPDLVIPHPLMQEREFVMKPLMEIKKNI
jgi:2-amino-4-hydroxy-6-hydroxymethyldihydropteridine diphosphokinase